jgi:hypothetical protein
MTDKNAIIMSIIGVLVLSYVASCTSSSRCWCETDKKIDIKYCDCARVNNPVVP